MCPCPAETSNLHPHVRRASSLVHTPAVPEPFCCLQVEPSSVKEACGATRAMVGEALLLLIQKPSAISSLDCPEALLLDLQRLVATQNELQRLSLIGASLLVAQMLLGAKGLPSLPLTAENRRCRLQPQIMECTEFHILGHVLCLSLRRLAADYTDAAVLQGTHLPLVPANLC